MSFSVIQDWTTKAGFRAVVTLSDLGHHCGYVGIPKSHPLHGKSYSENCEALEFPAEEPIGKRGIIPILCRGGETSPDVVFDVHGGITYSDGGSYPVESDGLWWFGYDCGHSGDGKSEKYLKDMEEKFPDMPFMWSREGVFRDVAYCENECESLAKQLVDRVKGVAQ